jgi:hypothetical protein
MEQETEVLPNLDVNEAQFDKFFETGGELPAEQEVAEPVVETESQPEEPQIVSEDATTKDKVDKVVPYGALHEERERRKELQRTVQAEQERIRRLEETFQKVLERTNSNNAPVPSYEDDPAEALRVKTERLEQAVSLHNQTLAQQQQQAESQRQYSEFVNRYQESAKAYMQEQPDFKEAYQHLVNSRIQEYQAAGYSYNEANNIIVQDELAIASKAYQDGVNPAERLYSLAKARGYQHQQQAEAKPQANEAVQKLEQLEKGLNASKSLSTASGKATTELTLEALANMDDSEFDKAWDKMIKGAK